MAAGLSIAQLVNTAWASAATFRGGANGARIRLAPQKDWEVNQPAELASVLQELEALTNDFFVNLIDMKTSWQKSASAAGVLEGRDRASGELMWTGTVVDLVFGSNAQLRALAEVYACSDSRQTFVHDFVAAWNKVINLDRFDLG